MIDQPYRGRFAPSPTGPLHAGSLAAAWASYADARAHGGTWLVRMEDVDAPRCVHGATNDIMQTLADYGMVSDEPVLRQSTRHAHYEAAFQRLLAGGHVYACGCTRVEIADSLVNRARPRHREAIYPGTCRNGLAPGKLARAWRLRVTHEVIEFADRACGAQRQNVATEVGDFVLKRADGQWAYQLAVVVDDAEQGITHVVRGADLLESTARQIVLQRLLGLPTPQYLHVPVVTAADGEKLSKQNGATPLPRDARGKKTALAQARAWVATCFGA